MLSIIMPVYNTMEYLKTSVDNVLQQSYRDFELILVDDGSTDGSAQLCDELAQTDHRIRVVHKPNGGVASARNAGLDVARGAYIGWVDSDDLISPFMYQIMTAVARQNDADIVQCTHVRDPRKLNTDTPPESISTEILGPIDSLKRIYRSHYTNSCALWSKIYRRSLFEGIRFTEGTAFEDDEIVPRLLHRGQKNVYIELPLYCYVKRENSIITAPSIKNILALSKHLENRMLWCRELDDELFELSCRSYFGFLRYKTFEQIFQKTPVQREAVAKLKKYRKLFRPRVQFYNKIALLLLSFPGGTAWVVKSKFEPIQSILRVFRRK